VFDAPGPINTPAIADTLDAGTPTSEAHRSHGRDRLWPGTIIGKEHGKRSGAAYGEVRNTLVCVASLVGGEPMSPRSSVRRLPAAQGDFQPERCFNRRPSWESTVGGFLPAQPLSWLPGRRSRWEGRCSNTERPKIWPTGGTRTVIAAKASILDFLCGDKGKSWIPAFAGMTRWGSSESQSFRCLV